MWEFHVLGSVRGAPGNRRPYREPRDCLRHPVRTVTLPGQSYVSTHIRLVGGPIPFQWSRKAPDDSGGVDVVDYRVFICFDSHSTSFSL